jgi:hypothetical protein
MIKCFWARRFDRDTHTGRRAHHYINAQLSWVCGTLQIRLNDALRKHWHSHQMQRQSSEQDSMHVQSLSVDVVIVGGGPGGLAAAHAIAAAAPHIKVCTCHSTVQQHMQCSSSSRCTCSSAAERTDGGLTAHCCELLLACCIVLYYPGVSVTLLWLLC